MLDFKFDISDREEEKLLKVVVIGDLFFGQKLQLEKVWVFGLQGCEESNCVIIIWKIKNKNRS